jgi:hypothetical protein
VTVYSTVDDLYKERIEPAKPVRRGRKPAMSDSEVLALALLAQWYKRSSERGFVGWASRHWRAYFPRVLSQSAFNRRLRDLTGALAFLGPLISRRLEEQMGGRGLYEVLDSVPVPLMHCCRGRRHRLFADEAAVGRGGSDHDWYYGVQMLAAVSEEGLITGFVVGSARTEERWLAESLMRWRKEPLASVPRAEELEEVLGRSHGGRKGSKRKGRVGPLGPIGLERGVGESKEGLYIADAGFEGETWQRHWSQDYGAVVLTRGEYQGLEGEEQHEWSRWLSGLRQIVERTFSALVEVFSLTFPRARTYWGLLARIAAKVAAFNIGGYINRLCNKPTLSIFDPVN